MHYFVLQFVDDCGVIASLSFEMVLLYIVQYITLLTHCTFSFSDLHGVGEVFLLQLIPTWSWHCYMHLFFKIKKFFYREFHGSPIALRK